MKNLRGAVAFFFLFFLSRNFIWNTSPLLLVTDVRRSCLPLPLMRSEKLFLFNFLGRETFKLNNL